MTSNPPTPPRDDAPTDNTALVEANKALTAALEYLRGEASGVTSGGHRNGTLRDQIKWVLLGCDDPLRGTPTPAAQDDAERVAEARGMERAAQIADAIGEEGECGCSDPARIAASIRRAALGGRT